MSEKSQTKNMKLLAELLSNDLGYIYGESENGPNGAKKQFLSTGRAFLSALGKDLGFIEQKIIVNNSGIACSGDVTLMGMWSQTNGLYIKLRQDLVFSDNTCMLFRSIKHLKDYTGGANDYYFLSELRQADYNSMMSRFLLYRREDNSHERRAA